MELIKYTIGQRKYFARACEYLRDESGQVQWIECEKANGEFEKVPLSNIIGKAQNFDADLWRGIKLLNKKLSEYKEEADTLKHYCLSQSLPLPD